MNSKPLYNYPGESADISLRGYFIVFVLFILGVACFFAVNLTGLITGIVLLGLCLFILSKVITEVAFYDSHAQLKYLMPKKIKDIKYEQIKLVRPTTEPRTGERLFVAELRSNASIKKFTWNCSDKEYIDIKPLLKNHGVRMVREE